MDHHTAIMLDQMQELRSQSHSLGRIEARLMHGDGQFKDVQSSLGHLNRRVSSIEDHLKTRRLKRALSLAREVMPLKEWFLGGVAVASSLMAAYLPAETKQILISLADHIK